MTINDSTYNCYKKQNKILVDFRHIWNKKGKLYDARMSFQKYPSYEMSSIFSFLHIYIYIHIMWKDEKWRTFRRRTFWYITKRKRKALRRMWSCSSISNCVVRCPRWTKWRHVLSLSPLCNNLMFNVQVHRHFVFD
jgi:hypothetical protein